MQSTGLALYLFVVLFSAICCFLFSPKKAHAENLSLSSLNQTIVTVRNEILELQANDIVNNIEELRNGDSWQEVIKHPLSHPELEENLADCLTYAKQLQANLDESMHFISHSNEFEQIQKIVEILDIEQTRNVCVKLREQGLFSSETKLKGRGITKDYLIALINHCKIYKPKLVLDIVEGVLNQENCIKNA